MRILFPLPVSGTAYEASVDSLEACGVMEDFRDRAYGGMPIQLGMCWGYNTRLNCLEYHRDSEINVGTEQMAAGASGFGAGKTRRAHRPARHQYRYQRSALMPSE